MRKKSYILSDTEKEEIKNLFFNTRENTVRDISEKLNIPENPVGYYIDKIIPKPKY